MKMTVALAKINLAGQALKKLASAQLPAKDAFKVARFVKQIDTHYVEIEQQRVALVQKYGAQDKQGDLRVLPEKMGEFNKEFQELLSEEIEIEVTPLKLELLGDAPLSPLELLALEPFIDAEF